MRTSQNWKSRKCPSCGSTDIELSPVQTATTRAEKLSFEEIKKLFIGLRADQIFFTYHRCSNCNLAYNTNYFSQSQLDVLYHLMPNNLMGENVGTASKTQYKYADQILRQTKKVETVLELGPDIGLIGKRISGEKSNCSAILVEPNIGVYGDLEANSSNFTAFEIVPNLDEVRTINKSKPDLIIGIHVLDHLLQPEKTLTKLHNLADDLATLCIVVHNEKSMLRFFLNKRWPPFCLQHPQLFNRQTIKSTLEHSGWKIIKIQKTVNYYSVRNLVKNFLAIINLPIWLSKLFPNLEVPLILGNILIIAQRKELSSSHESL